MDSYAENSNLAMGLLKKCQEIGSELYIDVNGNNKPWLGMIELFKWEKQVSLGRMWNGPVAQSGECPEMIFGQWTIELG